MGFLQDANFLPFLGIFDSEIFGDQNEKSMLQAMRMIFPFSELILIFS